jgi:hypothetical protein
MSYLFQSAKSFQGKKKEERKEKKDNNTSSVKALLQNVLISFSGTEKSKCLGMT